MTQLQQLRQTFSPVLASYDSIEREAKQIYQSSMQVVKTSNFYPPAIADITANLIIERLKINVLKEDTQFDRKNDKLFELGAISTAEGLIEWYNRYSV